MAARNVCWLSICIALPRSGHRDVCRAIDWASRQCWRNRRGHSSSTLKHRFVALIHVKLGSHRQVYTLKMKSDLVSVTNFRRGHGGSPPCDLEFLARVTVLGGLTSETTERVMASASVVTLTRGEPLFRQGDPATAFFIVVRGWVKLCRTTLSGEEVVLDVLTKAESVAVAAALSGDRYAVTAEAVADACVVRIPADHVVRCIREMPEIAISMNASILQHVERLTQQIEQLKSQSAVQRAAGYLASLCPVDDGACIVALPYGKALIAARLGTKPESLSRAFHRLRLVGVEMHASHFAVRDVAKLRQLAASARCRWPTYSHVQLYRMTELPQLTRPVMRRTPDILTRHADHSDQVSDTARNRLRQSERMSALTFVDLGSPSCARCRATRG